MEIPIEVTPGELTRLRPDEFVHRLLFWTTQLGLHGAIDLNRLKHLAAEFAEGANLMPLPMPELQQALERQGLPPGRRRLLPYERGAGNMITRTGKLRRPQTTYYVLPRKFPHVPAQEPRPESASAQLDLFEQDGRAA